MTKSRADGSLGNSEEYHWAAYLKMHDAGNEDTNEVSVELTFHGLSFAMTVDTVDDTLVIHAEEKQTGDRWRGQFSSRYIEEITHKTGNYKKFAVFVKMLTSALTTESDSVFIDLLTYSDLELLKSRKTGRAAPAQSATAPKNNKRYLIMTYAVEFDRVHYPLPLNFEDSPDPTLLKQTIARLRHELAEVKRYNDAPATSGSDNGLQALRAQLEKERRAREQAESSVASGRREHSRRLHELERANEDLRAELEHTQTILREGERQASRVDDPAVGSLRRKLAEREEELAVRTAEHKRAASQFRQDNAELKREVDKARNAAKHARAKLVQVENELAIARKRLSLASKRSGTPSGGGGGGSFGRSGSAQRSKPRPRSNSPAVDRSGSGGRRPSSGKPRTRAPSPSASSSTRRPGSARSASSKDSRGRYRSPSPASGGRKTRGVSPSLTRPTSADRRRREDVLRREQDREAAAAKLERFKKGGNSKGSSARPSSAERRRAYSDSLRERQGLSPALRSSPRGGSGSGSDAERSDATGAFPYNP